MSEKRDTLCNMNNRDQIIQLIGNLSKQEYDITVAMGTLDLSQGNIELLAELGSNICTVKQELMDSI